MVRNTTGSVVGIRCSSGMGPGPPTSGPTVRPGTDVGVGGTVVVLAEVLAVLLDVVERLVAVVVLC